MAEDSKVRQTSTRTEIQGKTENIGGDLFEKAQKKDPHLTIIQGEPFGQVFHIPDGATVIGRSPECGLRLMERSVSAHHARLLRQGNLVVIEDLKSTNGTALNNNNLSIPKSLEPDDLIKIGKTVFRYRDNHLDAQTTESLHKKGTTDPMTGVFNKEHILMQLAASIEVAKQGYPLCLVMIDLDHFKKINDTHGHLAGDYVLKESCRLLRDSILRAEDIFGRYGGEEFTLIMPDTPFNTALQVAERVRASIQTHGFVFDSKKIPVTASLGVTLWKPQYATVEAMIDAADKLLYEAKRGGRNRVVS